MIGVGTTIFLVNPATFPTTGFTNTKSLLFDGVDESLDTSNISALQNVSTFSVSAWVKLTADNDFVIMRRYLGTGNAILALYYDGVNLNSFIYNGSSTKGSVSWSPSVSTWYHLTMTYNGGGATNADKLKIYINGVNQTLTFSGTIPSTTRNTSGNYEIVGKAAYLDGNADEVALFNYELTSGQVTSLYNSGTPTDLDNTSGVTAPVHWWRMGDGDTFPTITDVGTTGGNDGTMTNMESGDIVTDTP